MVAEGIFVLDWEDFIEKVRRFNSGNKVCWMEGNELKAILVSSIRWGFKTTRDVEEKKETLREFGFVIAEKVPNFRF